MSSPKAEQYWKSSLRIVFLILSIWFVVAYCGGIIFREWLDENFFKIGNAPFGFWIAQQGAIITFVILLITYTALMNKLDHDCEYDQEEKGS